MSSETYVDAKPTPANEMLTKYAYQLNKFAFDLRGLELMRKVWSDEQIAARCIESPRLKMNSLQTDWIYHANGRKVIDSYVWGGFNWPDISMKALNYCCGVEEIQIHYLCNDKQVREAILMANLNNRSTIICTANDSQQSQVDLLLKHGFNVIKDWHTNPNSGNQIIILMRDTEL